MHDIASQLVLKWARHGPDHKIQVTDDFTRLTLDTISLCSMDYRFNSFYRNELHPFVGAMNGFLIESGRRAGRLSIQNLFMRAANQKYEADINLMKSVSDEVVKRRKENPSDKKDLLNAMLNGKDPVTGEGMTDQLIVNNMITFLIAGILSLLRFSMTLFNSLRSRNHIWIIIILVPASTQEQRYLPCCSTRSR